MTIKFVAGSHGFHLASVRLENETNRRLFLKGDLNKRLIALPSI